MSQSAITQFEISAKKKSDSKESDSQAQEYWVAKRITYI